MTLFFGFGIIKTINSECVGVFMKKMTILLSVILCCVLAACSNVNSDKSSGQSYHVKCADSVDIDLSLSPSDDYSLFVQSNGDRFYVYRTKAEVPTTADGDLDISSDVDIVLEGAFLSTSVYEQKIRSYESESDIELDSVSHSDFDSLNKFVYESDDFSSVDYIGYSDSIGVGIVMQGNVSTKEADEIVSLLHFKEWRSV